MAKKSGQIMIIFLRDDILIWRGANPPQKGVKDGTPVWGRANMAHISQSWPDAGLGFQAKDPKTFQVVPFSRGSGDLSDTMYSLLSFRKSTLPQNRQLHASNSNSKQ